MSLEEFKKLQKDESNYYEILGYLIPVIIFASILFLIAIDSNVNPSIFLIPFIYPVVFFGIYEKKYMLHKKTSSAEYYFKRLNYDKAIIRYSFLEKIFRNFIIVVIIIGLLGVVGITLTFKSINESIMSYNTNDLKYKSERTKILNMNQDELRKYFKDMTANMTQYSIEQNLLNIVTNQIKQNFTGYNDANSNIRLQTITELETQRIKKMDEIQQQEELLQRINGMSFEDLKQTLISDIETTKPTAYFINTVNDVPKTLETLIVYVYIPSIWVYTVFLSKRSLTSRKDFHYHYAIGCFAIVSAYPNIDDMEKRKYVKLGITHYNKFINKNLNLHIKNIDSIYSRLLTGNPESLVTLSSEMENTLATQHYLKLLDLLKKKPDDDNSEILATTSYLNKIKEGSGFIISVVSTISALITILTKLS